jgi:hypothetical protein
MESYVDEKDLVYINPCNSECAEHEVEISKVLNKNPYWLLYDLIKNEERDGRAFAELIDTIDHYAERAKDVQGKIDTNVKGISEAGTKKPNMKILTMKGTP